MIGYLDKTIENLLTHEKYGIKRDLCGNVSVSFAPPDASFPSASLTLPVINVFLYELQERKELRGAWENIRQEEKEGVIYQTLPPVWMDCSYLISAWTKDDDIFGEHMILAEALRVLARHEKFPEEVYHEKLAGDDPEAIIFESKILPIQTSDVQKITGGKTKATVHCMVTMGVSLREEMELGGPVKERRFLMDGKDKKTDRIVGEEAEELVFKEKNKFPEPVGGRELSQ